MPCSSTRLAAKLHHQQAEPDSDHGADPDPVAEVSDDGANSRSDPHAENRATNPIASVLLVIVSRIRQGFLQV